MDVADGRVSKVVITVLPSSWVVEGWGVTVVAMNSHMPRKIEYRISNKESRLMA